MCQSTLGNQTLENLKHQTMDRGIEGFEMPCEQGCKGTRVRFVSRPFWIDGVQAALRVLQSTGTVDGYASVDGYALA